MIHPLRRRIRHASLVVTTLFAASLAVAAPAAARSTIDPSTVNPPIPLTSNPRCGWTGQDAMCLTDRTFDVVGAATGIFCGDAEVLEDSHRHVTGQRRYNSDLDLIQTRFLEQIDGYLYVPDVGSIRWTGNDYGVQTLSVPGDRSTGIGWNGGAGIHLYPAAGGSITLAGRTIENFDTGSFFQVGSSPEFDLCALLA